MFRSRRCCTADAAAGDIPLAAADIPQVVAAAAGIPLADAALAVADVPLAPAHGRVDDIMLKILPNRPNQKLM